MSADLNGWDRLRHGGLLLDTPRLRRIAARTPPPLHPYYERQLRRLTATILDEDGDVAGFTAFVLEQICGFTDGAGSWQAGTQIGAEWGRRSATGEVIKPRRLWRSVNGAILPVFVDGESRLGIGRGRKGVSQVLQWLRSGSEKLALLTNGRQWRLIFAGLDFDAWCEWDVDLWFEEGELSPQIDALRTILTAPLWTPPAKGTPSPLLQAILDSRKGQAELSAALGERVREAVEALVQAHGDMLREKCADIDSADIYRAAVRVIMRMVVVLFAESRELLPRENPLYHGSYGLNGLIEELERTAARGGGRLARSGSAWPRVLALFRLVHQGAHHPALPVPAYGGELFAPGNPSSPDGVVRALALFETAAFDREILPDRDVHRILHFITRTKVKVRQGRGNIWIPAPVDFSDLSSEYIGILYEGLLDFELKTAPPGDPVIFLAVGNQPALPLSRLEGMDDRALANLLEKMKDTSRSEEGEEEGEKDDDAVAEAAVDKDVTEDEESVPEENDSEEADAGDERHATRTRAETWARRAAAAGKLVKKPKGAMSPERLRTFEEAIARKARQLVIRVILPGEWYLVRWGGTRKGAGTFYTRPGLAVPTVQRTLRPLAYTPPCTESGAPDNDAPAAAWIPRKPEEILGLKVCDPACGSGTFPVAALRFLTDALYLSLHHHGRITPDGDRAVVALLSGTMPETAAVEERLGQELLPCLPEDPLFEPRLKAILRRYVVERSIYGVDLDPLAVELCRLSLWIETMDRSLPFSFLDHKIKPGNSLVGAWFDQFQHYPVMAWKNREGGDKGHTNGVHFAENARGKAIKAFVKETLTPDLRTFLSGRTLFSEDLQEKASAVHAEALALLSRLHELPVQESAERARLYREELLGAEAYRSLKSAMDLWCACWFWPADQLESAPLPTTFAAPSERTCTITEQLAAQKRFFHWELEFPDVFCSAGSGFDAILGNPPWETLQPNPEEFFSNIDPLFRTYGRLEKQARQKALFAGDASYEREWLEYSASFNSFSCWIGNSSSPFGDSEQSTTGSFSIGRGNRELHSRWREQRHHSDGYSSPEHPYRYQTGRLFTYKLFLEKCYSILRDGGRLGLITPSGIYSDHWSQPLRELFLDACRWEWLFGFENREKVFDIDSRFKFNPIIVEKGGRTEAIRVGFMRRKIDDWENAESFVALYGRSQIEHFSPHSKAVLEIQSQRDLDIIERIYANSVILGDDNSAGWHIRFRLEFMMNTDIHLFPPKPKWEGNGYLPDEYSRWLKGAWRPIAELWSELKVQPLAADQLSCAQPPYDTLPIPRADIPAGIILSRTADAWIEEDVIEDIALPLYEGRMIGQFDSSQKGWVSGKGRSAVWREIPWDRKQIEPQFCMRKTDYFASERTANAGNASRVAFMDVGSATNERTMIASIAPEAPCGNSVPVLTTSKNPFSLAATLNSFAYDFVMRRRCSGLHLNYFVIEDSPVLSPEPIPKRLEELALRLSGTGQLFASLWLDRDCSEDEPLKRHWALSESERRRTAAMADAVVTALYGLQGEDLRHIMSDCDRPRDSADERQLNPKGFWRVDKDKDPELRHTVLTMVAFHDLEEKIRGCGGDREEGIEAFLMQNDGEGWMIPETLRLADYGLGHDERAKAHQPVANRLGPRFYDWQLAQSPEESWRECHLHARNLLGESGHSRLLSGIQDGGNQDAPDRPPVAKAAVSSGKKKQGSLFE